MALLRRPEQASRANASVVASNSNQSYLHYALSSTGVKIAGASLFAAICLVVAAETDGNRSAITNVAQPSHASQLKQAPATTPPASTADTSGTSASTGSASNNSTSSVSVTVNGQDVPVPANGSTNETIDNGNGGTTQVQVNHQTSGNSTNSSHSSMSVSTNSFSAGSNQNTTRTYVNGAPMQ